MIRTWTSTEGLVLRDLVPAGLRRNWISCGHYPNRDIYGLFAESAAAHPDRDAVIDEAGAVSYSTVDTLVRARAGALAAAGLGPRDVIGIQVPNGRDAVIAELAVAAIGAVALPYPAGRGTRDTVALLGRARARAVLTGDAALAEQVTSVLDELPRLRSVFVHGPAPAGCLSFMDAPVDPAWRPAEVDPEAPARIMVSSGSEAAPKMVVYPHNAMVGGRGNYLRALHRGAAGADLRDLVLVPLASSFGSFGAPVTLARFGGTLLTLRRFDPADALRAIVEHRPTHVFGVPTMLRRMAELCDGEDLTSLRAVVASGAALPPATAGDCRRRFGCPVIAIYGSTDGVNCHTATPEHGVGVPDPAVADIRIVDGEIQALGPMTPWCHVGDPALDTHCRAPGGWVRTGDRGEIGADGTLHVLGRLREVVIRGGRTISPAEVERHVSTHPSVAEAVCVGTPDPDLGERLCACLVLRPEAPAMTVEELGAFLERERGLERTKLPERVIVLPSLPLGVTGKVCRRTLTRLAASELEYEFNSEYTSPYAQRHLDAEAPAHRAGPADAGRAARGGP